MDQKILTKLTTLETAIIELQKALVTVMATMVTKDDAKNFLTKDDAKNFLTKDDAKNFATKEDIKVIMTKLEELNKMQMAIFETVDTVKEDKHVVKDLQKRVTRLEKNVFV